MKFQYWKAKDEWRWHLVGGNGEIIASGESYERKKDCLIAIEMVKQSASAEVEHKK